MIGKQQVDSWLAYLILIAISLIVIFIFNIMSNSMDKENDFTAKAVSSVNNSVEGFILQTNKGNIEIKFHQDNAPMTVNNFIKLTEEGFYDGTKFHRVIENFMIQGGDPLSKEEANRNIWGTGGPGYMFDDEINENNKNNVGTISMANAGPNTNGSQFFINVADNNFLDEKHTVFGEVVSGWDIVLQISQVETTPGNDQPVEDVIVKKVTLK